MAVRAEGVLVKVNVVGVESQLSAAVRAGVGNQVVVGIFLLGGVILIGIGLEIFISGILG